MSTIITETMHSLQQNSPDFSFPSTYHPNEHPEPPRSTALVPPTNEVITVTPINNKNTSTVLPPLLSLPLEIRLHIYHYVLSSHPIFHAHLAPPPESYSSSTCSKVQETHTTIVRPLGQSFPTTSVLTSTATIIPTDHQPISTLYPRSNPSLGIQRGLSRGKIPTGLLASCKQVYEEAHMLPWEQNTFSFINWFWSGVYASRQFTRGLRPWQSDGIRWVGVEVLTRDLTSTISTQEYRTEAEARKGRTDWEELCYLWKGVWGLRLGIKGSVRGKGTSHAQGEGIFFRPEELPSIPFECKNRGVLDVENEWVREGLLTMKALKWIELEVEDEEAEREHRIAFCQDLERCLNSEERSREEGWNGPTKVVLVEKSKREVVSNANFVWFGGAPGNESISGED